jgi:hypothetical protein
MPHMQNGTRNPPFLCEDVPRCEWCLAPIASGCHHLSMSDEEREQLERERRSRPLRRYRCPCNPDCTRTILA